MKRSTRNVVKMHGWRIDRAIHNYIYFVYYRLYVSLFLQAGRFLARRFLWLKGLRHAFRFVFVRYHGKVLSASDARKIITLNRDLIIGPDKSERIIPFQYANKIILKETDFIAVMDCPCRLIRDNPCQSPGSCMAIGRTTAEFWLEHGEKYHVRKINQAEALRIIMDARERGCITAAWFKVATGGRTGVICSCCRCCCGGMEGTRIGQKFDRTLSMMAPSGYAVIHDPGTCKSCKKCSEICMFNAVTFSSDNTRVYDSAACMGCGLCTEKCQQHALSLVRDPSKGEPLDIDSLKETLQVGRQGGESESVSGVIS
jgi:Pyruvate/2-oxoacid:ferredoxin oxidoreductase delta subunit